MQREEPNTVRQGTPNNIDADAERFDRPEENEDLTPGLLRLSRRSLGLATFLGGMLGLGTRRAAAQGNAVPIPETPNGRTLVPTVGSDGVKRVTLTASQVEHTILSTGGKTVVAKAYGFNGDTPGPTLVFYEGDQVAITVVNNLPEPTAIHWHGVIVPNSQDGVPEVGQPTPQIPPGGSYTYRYQIVQGPGTHMYHSHADIRSEILGLTGGFIILPKSGNGHGDDDSDGNRGYDRDVVYWLHSWAMPQTLQPQIVMGNMLVGNPTMRDRPFTSSPVDTVNSVDAEPEWQTMSLNFFTMNGKSYPNTDPIQLRLGQKLRVRFFNINLLSHPIHLHGQNFLHIAEDGVTLKQPQEMNTIEVAPGKTQDILITAQNPGVWPLHCHIAHHQANNFSSGFGGMATVVRIS